MQNSTKMSEREAVFQAWDEMHADLPAEHDGLELTPELIRAVRRRAREIRGNSIKLDVIEAWLSDPDAYTPYPDPVLVQRAFDMDETAIAALNWNDRQALLDRLAAMDDPFDADMGWSGFLRQHGGAGGGGGTSSVGPGDGWHGLRSGRRMRFLALPEPVRFSIKNGVHSRESRARKRAAA